MNSSPASSLSTREQVPGTFHYALIAIVALVMAWSAIHPHDRFTWWLEVIPVFVGFAILGVTRRSFPLTRLVYTLIAIHMIILAVGGHYTYARVPLFDLIKEWFSLTRNHYDRVGHFAQGFVPAMIAREILIRRKVVQGRGWVFFLTTCICLSISVIYEWIEWWTALGTGEASTDFLGTQGDIWDTQSDMFLCGIGAVTAQLTLNRLHDRALALLRGRTTITP